MAKVRLREIVADNHGNGAGDRPTGAFALRALNSALFPDRLDKIAISSSSGKGSVVASTSLFDDSGRRIGFTETRDNGNIVAYDANGKPRGYFSASSDYTFEIGGRRVGNGNQVGPLFR